VLRWNPKTRERSVDQLVWGLLPHDTEDPATALRPIMARAETVATNPTFASAFRDRRAIVPMSVYYQRRSIGGSRELYKISRRDGDMMAVAGLWEAIRWPAGNITRTYCIITTEPNSLIAPIQDAGRAGKGRLAGVAWGTARRSDVAAASAPGRRLAMSAHW